MKQVDWTSLLAKYKASGLTQVEFARRNGVSKSGLNSAARRNGIHLRVKTNKHVNGQAKHGAFLQVGVVPMILIDAGKGITLQVPTTISATDLRNLLKALSNE